MAPQIVSKINQKRTLFLLSKEIHNNDMLKAFAWNVNAINL